MKSEKKVNLTKFSPGAGWACKLSANDLTQVLSKLKIPRQSKNSSGFESFDDCSIYKINEKQSIIQTVDFFTPIVDDPYTFGQISASNSLSDIYAMGGKPLFALNIVGFPSDKLDLSILSDILQGGIDKCNSADIQILGGHTIKDDVPKYGLAVTGLINNEDIITNDNANVGDDIILTKPIGSGIIATSIKNDLVDKKTYNHAVQVMKDLNKESSKIMQKYNINSCTDVTGFGLLGHLSEMCKGSNVSAVIHYNKIPLLTNTENFAKKDIIPGGSKKNFDFLKDIIHFHNSLEHYQKLILSDAQTSGGLLISCDKKDSINLLMELNESLDYKASIIGEFTNKKNHSIYCE